MIVGIDLGTTNSLVVYWDKKPIIIPNTLEEYLTPSVVGIDDDGSILIGKPAMERLFTNPQLTTANFKRYMGSQREIFLGDKKFYPEELSALVLKSLKADAEKFLKQEITEAVISVPAYFNDKQRKATKLAGELAGLKVERLINEPTAAGLAYGIHENQQDKSFLVFDLGGGTFDVSIIELFDRVMEIKASTGDNYLGGEDFTHVVANQFAKLSGLAEAYPNYTQDRKILSHLRAQAERAKIQLTEKDQVKIQLQIAEKLYQYEFTTQSFEHYTSELRDRIAHPLERALRDSQLKIAEINYIVLVGGASRMGFVRKMLAKMFNKIPLAHLDPDQVVALGAAVQAGLKKRDRALSDVVVTDVCPYTLGVDAMARATDINQMVLMFSPIIERNTVVPVSKSKTFYTLADYQSVVEFNIYQGESPSVAENILLGKLSLPVPINKAGKEGVEVRFTYDINGLLEVEATALSTQYRKSIIIENNPGAMTENEIKKRLAALAKLKIHPRDQLVNRQLLARAERLYEEFTKEDRAYIGRLIADFKAALETQDASVIKHAIKTITQKLNDIEQKLGIF